MMDAATLRRWSGIVGILAGVVAIAIGFYAHATSPHLGYPWRPFIHVFAHTAVLSAVGMLIGMGIIMVIGGLIAFRNSVWGGLVMVVPAVIGLVYCYTHAWHRLDLIYFWAAPVVLAWVGSIVAGFALYKEVEPYDVPTEDDEPFHPHPEDAATS